ncbi:MAG TPA: ribosome biogenesis GTP-binding protein YihA/YsxC [Gemmatimonadales bacterium]|nr:ribosome biogenesis GTP-binding protein YihA/YsxC [Gemmatimonadales bacterium]
MSPGRPSLAHLPIEFVGSFPDPAVRLDPALPEVAFVGRSNVGKSSLLNALVGKKGLARVSATPGKTRLLNIFRLPGLYLVDLPGYGFARASKTARAGFRQLLDGYLRQPRSIAGVVWMLDIRRDLSADDLEVRGLLAESGHPVLAVLTKVDKLGREAVRQRTAALAQELDLPADHLQPTSVVTAEGIAELGESLLAVAEQGTPE